MPGYRIDLALRTIVEVEIEADSADAAWEAANAMLRDNDLLAAEAGRELRHYVDDVYNVRRRPEGGV